MDRRLLAAVLVLYVVANLLPGCISAANKHPLADTIVDLGDDWDVSKGIPAKGTAPSGGSDTADVQPPPRQFREKAEKFSFQAEVSRLMDIIINSLYSNKDIFLRELISNASDALDKIRFLALTDKSILGEGDTANLEIKIKVDKENNVLTIRDTGIGMTKEDLVNNLGTIAKSGTSAFLEKMQKGGDMNLIGQFGVGFYSVYLVSDYVEVITKHNDDKQYIWESSADGSFAVSEDTEGEPLGRGTLIRLHLKEETQEYADEGKLKELVQKYSEFINFPIYLWGSKEVDQPVDEEDESADESSDEETTDGADSSETDIADEEEEEAEDESPAPKTVKETVWDWELLNDNTALWLRNPGDVAEEEYLKFYRSLNKGADEAPMQTAHFKAEGDVEFRSILFIPASAPYDFWDNYYSSRPAIKLYVRRVFISDDFEELIPRYLHFVKGIVDSDTLPLSVSRETLQQHSALKTIKKKVVRKVLDLIKKLAEPDKPEGDESSDEEAPYNRNYETFWKEYGRALKLGVIEDSQNRGRLSKLLRFHTSKSPDKLTGFEEYVARMKEGQKEIYFLTGQSHAELENSPFVEQLVDQGYEVIYFTEPVDEYVTQHMKEFEDYPLQNVSKDDLKVGDKDSAGKKKQKQLKEEFKDLTKWWKDALGPDVDGVKLSSRLATTPCVVVTSKYGWSANMERIMRAQALTDTDKQAYMKGRKILEINPRHPLITRLKAQHSEDPDSEATRSLATLLYDTALIESGFPIEDPKAFNSRVYGLMKSALGIEGELSVPADEAEDAAEEETEEGGSKEDAAPPKAQGPEGTTDAADVLLDPPAKDGKDEL